MPTFATEVENRPIRVYDIPQNTRLADTTDEDSDSGMEALVLIEQTDDQRLVRNEQYLTDHIGGWTLSPPGELARNGRPIQTVESPTISRMSSWCLHPYLYTKNIQSANLEEMAEILGTKPRWYNIFRTTVANNPSVTSAFNSLRSSEEHEPTIQFRFARVVQTVSDALCIELAPNSEKRVVIGGMLVREELNVCGNTDPYFQNANGRPVLGSEVKTNRAFPRGTFWHRGKRAGQVLSSLYNLFCPIALLTQMQYKFFFESDRRDVVFTFPADQDPEASQFLNASLMGPMGTDFLKAICICLLSPRTMCAQEPELSEVAALSKTPTPRRPLSRLENSADRSLRSTQDKKSSQTKANPAAKPIIPKFVSGHCDGRPVYTEIRVASDEAADGIWQRIKDAAAAATGAETSELDRRNLRL